MSTIFFLAGACMVIFLTSVTLNFFSVLAAGTDTETIGVNLTLVAGYAFLSLSTLFRKDCGFWTATWAVFSSSLFSFPFFSETGGG